MLSLKNKLCILIELQIMIYYRLRKKLNFMYFLKHLNVFKKKKNLRVISTLINK